MICVVFPEILKLTKPSPEVVETGTWKTVPITEKLAFWAAQKQQQRGGQRWFDHHFRPTVSLFWKTKKKEMERDMWTTNHNF